MTKTQETLLDTVRRSRAAIREHRDQIGDYRCWVDDEVLYHSTLPELNDLTPEPPDINEFMRRCEAYHSNRQDPSEPKASIPMDSSVGPLPLIYSPELDADLIAMTSEQLRDELDRLWEAIRVHRSIGHKDRNYHHDQTLYLILPERKLAVTQLPPRELFIGGNCPAYAAYCQENKSRFAMGTWEKKP